MALTSELFTYYFDQDPFVSPAVKLAVENLFPRAKIKPAFRHGDHHFAAHYLAFEMRIPVVFSGPVVLVLGNGLVRCQPFEPSLIILMKTRPQSTIKKSSGIFLGITREVFIIEWLDLC